MYFGEIDNNGDIKLKLVTKDNIDSILEKLETKRKEVNSETIKQPKKLNKIQILCDLVHDVIKSYLKIADNLDRLNKSRVLALEQIISDETRYLAVKLDTKESNITKCLLDVYRFNMSGFKKGIIDLIDSHGENDAVYRIILASTGALVYKDLSVSSSYVAQSIEKVKKLF